MISTEVNSNICLQVTLEMHWERDRRDLVNQDEERVSKWALWCQLTLPAASGTRSQMCSSVEQKAAMMQATETTGSQTAFDTLKHRSVIKRKMCHCLWNSQPVKTCFSIASLPASCWSALLSNLRLYLNFSGWKICSQRHSRGVVW